MNGYDAEQDFETYPPVRQLSKPQRRVLGVLVEKAYTVPESYPLTVKSLVSGSNQKSNRSPLTSYTEDAIEQSLEELRKMGLIAVIHTESGRTERYRHYCRKRFPFTEPQLAIITELLLRGRQQMGELRARASRMVPIESLQHLKSEVEGLLEQGYVQVDGPLDRRGVEIEHNFHLPTENARMAIRTEISDAPSVPVSSTEEEPVPSYPRSVAHAPHLPAANSQNNDVAELRAELAQLRDKVAELQDDLTQLRQSLGA